MKSFIISEEEKKRILNMHETMTKNHYLMEQDMVTIDTVTKCLTDNGYVYKEGTSQEVKNYYKSITVGNVFVQLNSSTFPNIRVIVNKIKYKDFKIDPKNFNCENFLNSVVDPSGLKEMKK